MTAEAEVIGHFTAVNSRIIAVQRASEPKAVV